jgi:hypothetical protein
MKREEPDNGVELAVECGHLIHQVSAVKTDFVAVHVEEPEPLEQNWRQVECLHTKPVSRQEERVSSHAASHLQHPFTWREVTETE